MIMGQKESVLSFIPSGGTSEKPTQTGTDWISLVSRCRAASGRVDMIFPMEHASIESNQHTACPPDVSWFITPMNIHERYEFLP